MKSLKNQIEKCSEIREDFNGLDVTNLFSTKDIEAHWNPDVKTSKYFTKIFDLFAEEYTSLETYVEGSILYFRFNNTDFAKLHDYVVSIPFISISNVY